MDVGARKPLYSGYYARRAEKSFFSGHTDLYGFIAYGKGAFVFQGLRRIRTDCFLMREKPHNLCNDRRKRVEHERT